MQFDMFYTQGTEINTLFLNLCLVHLSKGLDCVGFLMTISDCAFLTFSEGHNKLSRIPQC